MGDTAGGKITPYKQDYDYWMDLLQSRLKNITRWREGSNGRALDCKNSKFGDPKQILDYLNRLTAEQETCFNMLSNLAEIKGLIGFLNLLGSNQEEIKNTYKTFDSYWFADIQNFLLNSLPEKSGFAGVLVFEGKNADDEDCFFIKIRRAAKFSRIDLRTTEDKLKSLFGDLYMGGGGHAGAVSFRVHRMGEKETLMKIETICDFLNEILIASSNKPN